MNQLIKAIDDYVKNKNIPSAALLICDKSKNMSFRGWGLDAKGNNVNNKTIFRLASLTKSITRAAIMLLVRDGRLSLDDKAFRILSYSPLKNRKVNPKIYDISTKHLMNHRAGYDPSIGLSPTFQTKELLNGYNPQLRVNTHNLVRYMLSEPLQYKPGTKTVYSNFGYSVLGRLIEKISDKTYIDFIQERICNPIGISTLDIGSFKPLSNEVKYYSSDDFPDDPYGEIYNMSIMDSHGGLVCSPHDYIKFMIKYGLNGNIKNYASIKYQLESGNLPGTKAIAAQLVSGTNIVFLSNISLKGQVDFFDALIKKIGGRSYI